MILPFDYKSLFMRQWPVLREGQLPGAFDLESGQICAFAFGELVLDYLIDTAAPGAFAQRGAQFGKAFVIPADDDFDIAAFGIAHTALESKLAGLAMHKPAKADTLYTAFDEKVENHSLFSVADRGFSGKSGGKSIL